jgi:hypothetical protein
MVPVADGLFPIYYDVMVEGTAGTLEIEVDATDSDGALVGLGATSTTFGSAQASLWLQGVDFTVNTTYAGNQFITNDFETVGLQLAGSAFDEWMIGFREDCSSSCNVFGRRFDATGTPKYSNIAGGPQQFAFNIEPTTTAATPALVGTTTDMLAFWDFEQAGGGQGIACRSLDSSGAAFAPQPIVNEPADVVTAAYSPFGDRVIVTWQTFTTTQVIRTMTVTSKCDPLGVASTPQTVSITTGVSGARRSHVAATNGTIVYVWIVDGELYVRFATDAGTLTATEKRLLAKTATQEIDFVRVVPWGASGLYAVAVRWAAPSGIGPGKIEVYPLAATGDLGPPLLVTDQSASDFASDKAFGLASREDGMLMVVWHTCPTGASSCDVLGRYLSPAHELHGEAFMVPIDSEADQTNPSVAAVGEAFITAWTDASASGPDTGGTSVKARILVHEP